MLSRFLTTSEQDRCISWHLIFGFNLFVPCAFGLMETEGSARLGLLTGIVLLWYLGFRTSVRSPWLGTALNWGGIFVAWCQLMPIGHIYLGSWAVSLSKPFELVQHEYGYLTSFLGGLSATCITGGCLMLFSMLMGFVILALSELATKEKN